MALSRLTLRICGAALAAAGLVGCASLEEGSGSLATGTSSGASSSASGTTPTTAPTGGPTAGSGTAASGSTVAPTSSPTTAVITNSGGGSTSSTPTTEPTSEPNTTTTSSSGPTSSTTASSSSSGAEVTLGFECTVDADCNRTAGEVCCDPAKDGQEQCRNTCMVPCPDNGASECPVAGMACAHGFCLFPCANDTDCSAWDGYTCQHRQNGANTLCENDPR